ncbi:MAG TPA: sugar-binding protein [Planctomycetota bacterium]|nr:sugar-binding protein [Planctomycetota bacterium]
MRTALFLSLVVASEAATVEEVHERFGPPVIWVAKPVEPPTIDGKLDDAAWQKAEAVTLRFLDGLWEAPSQKTEARVLADDRAIYFAVKCWESEPERIVAAGDKRDGDLWNGDTVEVFLDPGHRGTRHQYAHIIVNPKGVVYDSKNKDARWNADLSVGTGKFDGGWTVELAVPMADLGVAGAVPKVWGLNINRQRPEMGQIAPVQGIRGHYEKLKDPAAYREGEDTAWSPTLCHSSHIVQRFGHAVLEAGTVEVKPPEKLFEVLFRANFDDGNVGPFEGAEIAEGGFRGSGKCIQPKGGAGTINFRHKLADLDDVTMIMALKMPQNGRLYYYGRAPDDEQCEADRHEVLMTPEEAKKRKFPAMDDYDTHGSMMAWKSHGRLHTFPGPWAMMTGHFSEPSIGSVMQPGTDWVILRTRLGQFHRQTSQGLVPPEQGYPNGLVFHAGREPFLLDDFVIFRGMDLAPPAQVAGLKAERKGDEIVLSWRRSEDNTLTAFYRACVGARGEPRLLAETHGLTLTLGPAAAAGKPITVTAFDLYGNASPPSEPVKAP